MPWHVEIGHADCADDEWAVVADVDGEVVGCHPSREDALRQIQALYAQEPAASAMVAAADADEHNGAMVAWLPGMDDAQRLAVPGGEKPAELHMTALYLGMADQFSPEQQQAIIAAATALAATVEAFTADARGLAVFNPLGIQPCLVALLNGQDLAAAQAALLADATLAGAQAPDAHAPWIPHVTLGYYDPAIGGSEVRIGPDVQARLGPLVIDRIRVAFAGVTTDIPLVRPAPPVAPDAMHPDMVAAGALPMEGTPFRIPLAIPEGVWSSSGRMFAPDSLTFAQPPLALKWQAAQDEDHTGAVIVGRIDGIERVEGGIGNVYGVMDDAGTAGAEALRLGLAQMLRGASAMVTDIDASDVELVWPADDEELDDEMIDGQMPATEDDLPAEGEEFHLPGKHNQKDHGKRGGPTYSRRGPASVISPRGALANPHYRDRAASGETFGPDGGQLEPQPREIYHAGRIRSLTLLPEPDFEGVTVEFGERQPTVVVASSALQADGSYTITIPKLYPEAWFGEPTPEEMPPFGAIQITAAGRITGWLAPPGVTHRAFRAMGRDVRVPLNIDYSEFNNKQCLVATADGQAARILAGTLTFDCGHAGPYDPRRADPRWATQHYENSCSVAARVRIAAHSANGVPFVAGALVHGIDGETVERMMGCALSGDWQGGKLKAALFVPSEGFPVSGNPSARVLDDQLVASSTPLRFVATVADEFDSLARTMGADAGSQFDRLREAMR